MGRCGGVETDRLLGRGVPSEILDERVISLIVRTVSEKQRCEHTEI